ncbi:MAG: hypothetical protein AAF799_01065 [Myxococcota bacterium]
MSARSEALEALTDEPPSRASWRRLLGVLLHWSAEPARERYVTEAEAALRSWPDELRTLSSAVKRRLESPPYPSWLRLVRVFDMTRRANRIREYDALVRLLDEGRLQRLHTFRLRYCTFGDPGLAHIGRRVQGLVELQLGNCCIGGGGVSALLESPNLGEIEELNLHSNSINDAGADVIADSDALVALRRVNLYRNQLSWEAIERVGERLRARGIRFIAHGQGGWAFGR